MSAQTHLNLLFSWSQIAHINSTIKLINQNVVIVQYYEVKIKSTTPQTQYLTVHLVWKHHDSPMTFTRIQEMLDRRSFCKLMPVIFLLKSASLWMKSFSMKAWQGCLKELTWRPSWQHLNARYFLVQLLPAWKSQSCWPGMCQARNKKYKYLFFSIYTCMMSSTSALIYTQLIQSKLEKWLFLEYDVAKTTEDT